MVMAVSTPASAANTTSAAGALNQRIERANERAGDIDRSLREVTERFAVVNESLAVTTDTIFRERDALLAQDAILADLRAAQDAALQALVEVQLQRALTGDATGAAIPIEVGTISDPDVRALVLGATQAGHDPLGALQAHAADAIARIDVQLDLSRELLVGIHDGREVRAHLLARQHGTTRRLESLRGQASESEMRVAALLAREGQGVSDDATVVVVDGAGPFSVCPVDAPRVIADDFGAPRYAGGYHEHAGNDILAPRGTPIRAPFDGVATDATNGLGGLSVRVTGPEGYVYNAHLDKFGALGRVDAGEIVGYVGNSGDAVGGPTHDHFEWHPDAPSGKTVNGAIDPHPALTLACSNGSSSG